MKFPLIIAHGQGLASFLLLGIPAAALGLVCLGIAIFLALKKKEADRKTVRKLSVIGGLLIAFLFVSPALDPVVRWVIQRAMPQK